MKILVRLPNWLGDMVMSIGFLNALKDQYPTASISVIAKKGIHSLLDFFPETEYRFIFSKDDHPGLTGAWKFGRMIRSKGSFDLFFCLPDSLSSAIMGFASGASKRIGYQKEFRGVLLTNTFKRLSGQHRVDEYLYLLTAFTGKSFKPGKLLLHINPAEKKEQLVININSEAASRRLPLDKAVSLLNALQQQTGLQLVFIGGKSDESFVNSVISRLEPGGRITNLAGKTSLAELVTVIAASKAVLTTDSGPAHVANAAGVPVVVLFGAGNENNTAPFNKGNLTIIRLGQLACEPCVKNTCVLYGVPKCLELLDERIIIKSVLERCLA